MQTIYIYIYIYVHHYNSIYVIILIIILPLPVITVTSTGTGVIGENYSVVCKVDVDDNLYNIFVNTTIVKIGESVVNSSMNSGDNSVSISYTPLMTSHSGQYQCVVNISQIDISYENLYFKPFTIQTASTYNTLYLISFLLYTRFL